jgi:hypothetical protein
MDLRLATKAMGPFSRVKNEAAGWFVLGVAESSAGGTLTLARTTTGIEAKTETFPGKMVAGSRLVWQGPRHNAAARCERLAAKR